jgi:NAD(P)-dependent dehydrogenase (short-subunit alcohol dehydrogenase family)
MTFEMAVTTMVGSFGATSTSDEVLSDVDLGGKRVLVTGISSGLGTEIARCLAAHGARVVGTVRNLAKAAGAVASVRAAIENNGKLELIELDLASLANVRACADALLSADNPLDLIIANAGVMAAPFSRTIDGFETQFGTNHLGHFVLINRIAALLAPNARVVSLASSGHRFADVDIDDPGFDHGNYEPWTAYGRSKTATILFTVEFDRRHRARGTRATAVHPGSIETNLGRHLGEHAISDAVSALNASLVAGGKPPLRMKTIPQGAATSLWAGVVASADEVGGRYCENCHLSPVVLPQVSPESEGVYPYALDPERARALWAKSEELVGERF